MQNTLWFAVFMGIVQYAAAILVAIGGFFFALTCFAWAIKMYDMIKEQCNLERLLDTPQKEREKMEGLTTYCFPEPEDEGPLTKICPFCGALYEEYKIICIDCKSELQPFRKPITEPLPQLTATDETAIKLNTLIQDIDEAEQELESELERVRTELEEKAYQYGNHRRPYTFTEEEALSIYNLYNRVRGQSHEEKRAS